MIFKETILKVSDNSGAKTAKCIGTYKNRKRAKIGDVILVSIQSLNKNNDNQEIKVGKKYKALVIRTKVTNRRNYHIFKFQDNAVILLNAQMNAIGNRIFGATIRNPTSALMPDIHKKIINITQKTF